jgi:hypothetical protein
MPLGNSSFFQRLIVSGAHRSRGSHCMTTWPIKHPPGTGLLASQGDFKKVLQRPVELARLTGSWPLAVRHRLVGAEFLQLCIEREYRSFRCFRGDNERLSSLSSSFLSQRDDFGLAERQHSTRLACSQSCLGWVVHPNHGASAARDFYPVAA